MTGYHTPPPTPNFNHTPPPYFNHTPPPPPNFNHTPPPPPNFNYTPPPPPNVNHIPPPNFNHTPALPALLHCDHNNEGGLQSPPPPLSPPLPPPPPPFGGHGSSVSHPTSASTSTIYSSATSRLPIQGGLGSSQPIHYTGDSLRASTNSFANENVIGEGGFHKVYPDELSGGLMVAINVPSRHGISQHDFDREINLFSGVRHENIIPLLGFCRGPQLLVYGYAPNSDLRHHLHGMQSMN
ncbi:pollen-specific leucine-rich repeat extensin-like protein 1 [Helianthus annuus]|uniref:pollen-specific leucine-rich repeat extensin-like protein 1 n=1 Tax=Helianthus annuus TaxID=4232 RepID=UPI000B9029CC|nr:pollen-specific leucine-rich repeat extensin-like protein 1 [Helianthus annuus]